MDHHAPSKKMEEHFSQLSCPVRFDSLTRLLYATDASSYRVQPMGVAFPKGRKQTVELISAAMQENIPIIPRGAGTGLTGGAIGKGIVVDMARYNKEIWDLNRDDQTVWVGPGVVLDALNEYLKPFGLCFGPDVATSSRATLGGMIGNNSSGARCLIYKTTADQLLSLEMVLSNGEMADVGNGKSPMGLSFLPFLDEQIEKRSGFIRERFSEPIYKRWPGYGLEHYLRTKNPAHLISGSEGTLAIFTGAKLKLAPLPKSKALAVILFDRVIEAMQATVEIMGIKPAAVEHIDRPLFDQTRNQPAFAQVRSMLELDEHPCESLLLVEFYDDVQEKMEALVQKKLGKRTLLFYGDEEMAMIWNMRKAGLSLLNGMPGSLKPSPGIEDAAIATEKLPDYVASLQKMFIRLGIDVSFYGHAGPGLLHVRPILDLHTQEGVTRLRQITDEVLQLVKQFKGSIAAEHGLGIERTQYLEEHIGPELMDLTRVVKRNFDPKGIMNPGKIVDDGTYLLDHDLRYGPSYHLSLPFDPVLAFSAKDKSFVGNLEQCNGCGECLKESPTMCPTYQAGKEEILSTRGRSNVLRSILQGKNRPIDVVASPELHEALQYCLSCKACKVECPSNVDMSLLKAELIHARHQKYGVALWERMIGDVETLARIGCTLSWISNFFLDFRPARWGMKKILGITDRRPLPHYAKKSFDRWFEARPSSSSQNSVILWDDTFTRYYDPHVGKAATRLLEHLGYRVKRVKGHKCCGRPAFSVGRLDKAYKLGCHNIQLTRKMGGNEQILFLEPSSFSMFKEDYLELKVPYAEEIAPRVTLLESFLLETFRQKRPTFKKPFSDVAVHVHCHAKKVTSLSSWKELLGYLGARVHFLSTGCCGMAGSFGMMESKYELSIQVAKPLISQIRELPEGTAIVACGTSCRQQIEHLANAHPLHIAEVFAQAF